MRSSNPAVNLQKKKNWENMLSAGLQRAQYRRFSTRPLKRNVENNRCNMQRP